MRPRDLLLAGLDSLRRQKLRTTLTTLGVTIGIATLVASVAVGVGVRRIIEDGFKREHRLREITVYPGFDRGGDEFAGVPEDALRVEGDMAPQRRDRIRKRLARDWRNPHTGPSPRPGSASWRRGTTSPGSSRTSASRRASRSPARSSTATCPGSTATRASSGRSSSSAA